MPAESQIGRGCWCVSYNAEATCGLDFGQEIAKRVQKLPPDMQEEVLRFVTSLSVSAPTGENGAALRQFASSLDSISARQMLQAINEECERVDATEW
jgi:hypothetical protein